MKIDIQNHLIEIEQSLDVHIQRSLRLAFSKMAAYISSITFILSDVVDQDGKTKKHCLLTLTLYRMPTIVIEETHVDLHFVINRVIQKATRIVTRKIAS